jgi:H+/Cl- antiporter ClcA
MDFHLFMTDPLNSPQTKPTEEEKETPGAPVNTLSTFDPTKPSKEDETKQSENAVDDIQSTKSSSANGSGSGSGSGSSRSNSMKRNKEWNTSLFPKPQKKKSRSAVVPVPPTINIPTSSNAQSNARWQEMDKSIYPDLDASNELIPQTYVQLLAIGIGITTGTSVAGFKLSIDAIRQFCFRGGLNSLWSNAWSDAFHIEGIVEFPHWSIPILGGLVVAILNGLGGFSPGLRGAVGEIDDDSLRHPTGAREERELARHDKTSKDKATESSILNLNLDLRPLRKAIGATFTLGTGNSLGPEGPGVEIGVAVSRVWMTLWPPDLYQTIQGKATKTNNNAQRNDDIGVSDNIIERMSRNRLLLACGAAAGVSSGFNAPLSGVFFALEVVQAALPPISILLPASQNGTKECINDDVRATTTSTLPTNKPTSDTNIELQQQSLSANPGSITAILISSVISTLVSRIFLGDELALQVLTYDIPTPLTELPLYLLLGIFCGIISVAFSQTAKLSKSILEGEVGPEIVKLFFEKLPSAVLPMIGGLVCGGVGYFYPQILFFGYETLNGLLENENIPTEILLTLLVAKIITTAVSAGSGLVGGTLAPSLFMGGMTGAAFHNIICQIFIALNIQETILTQGGGTLFVFATVPIYSSVGAASVLAALFRAPLTASLLVFEITRDYDILLPLLASAGVASLASDIIENKLDDSNKS